jgi:predicted lipid-binding transport protein (Tim44 family)
MHFKGGFPVDIVLLALVAGFLILRLRSVLGKRTGFERPPLPDQPPGSLNGPLNGPSAERGQFLDSIIPPTRQLAGRPMPAPGTVTAQVLGQIQAADRGFDPVRFIGTAETTFRSVVGAFAEGDLATLRNLLSPSVFVTFEQAIAMRNEAGEAQHTEIKAIVQATIDEAEIVADHAAIMLRFVSDQINFTRDRKGDIIAGTEAVTEIIDLWTFERGLNAVDPTWRLAAARSG